MSEDDGNFELSTTEWCSLRLVPFVLGAGTVLGCTRYSLPLPTPKPRGDRGKQRQLWYTRCNRMGPFQNPPRPRSTLSGTCAGEDEAGGGSA